MINEETIELRSMGMKYVAKHDNKEDTTLFVEKGTESCGFAVGISRLHLVIAFYNREERDSNDERQRRETAVEQVDARI